MTLNNFGILESFLLKQGFIRWMWKVQNMVNRFFFKIGGRVMSSKLKITLALVVMLSFAGSAQAGLFWSAGSGDWSDGSKWDVGTKPGAGDQALVLWGHTITVTGQEQADILNLGYVADGWVNVAAGGDLSIAGAMHVGQTAEGNLEVGTFNLYGEAYAEQLYVANERANGRGVLNIYSGGLMTVGTSACNIGNTGTEEGAGGRVNLKGGSMIVNALLLITDNGHIDIEEGRLSVLNDAGGQNLYYIGQYIDDDFITGYGGGTILTVDANSVFIDITASAPPTATTPTPADGQRKVLLTATLSWTGSTTEQDVYFGTDEAAVASATQASPEFKGRQTATTYNPGGLVAGQGYYWRIDEVVGSTVFEGTVWSFATERTEPILLTKGLVLDRQFHTMPVEPHNTIDSYDVAVIKHMGFTFAKVNVNPALMISGSTINTTNMAYVDEIVNIFLNQNVPVVVNIHPEPAFKAMYLGNDPAGSFADMLSFYHDFAGYLAARWGVNEVVFQLMTEPSGNYTDWNTMLPQMVSAVRSAMPNNTLIIGGASSGRISGLTALTQACVDAINDSNVYYGFTYWDEMNVLPFMFQGGGFGGYYPYLMNVPYPSSVSNNAADYVIQTGNPDYNGALAAVNAYCQTPWNMTTQQNVLQPVTDWNNARGGNLKLFCYEMGVPIDSDQTTSGGVVPADRIQYIHDKRLALEERNIGWAYWSYNETFTVLNYPLRVAFAKGVTKSQVSAPTLVALGLPCGCGCITDDFPAGDITGDCYVNFKDFAVIASSWLDFSDPNNVN
jgi:cellulase (glycosyl hydrolase family 5)